MKSSPLRSTRRRRGFSLAEAVVSVAISSLVAIPILSTVIFVTRTHATASDVSLSRLEADKVIERMKQDIRSTSRSLYNRENWPQLALADGNYTMTLLDSMTGQLITWSYDNDTQRLSRRLEQFTDGTPVLVNTDTFPTVFPDFRLEETKTQVVLLENSETGVITSVDYIGGVRILGRVFLRLRPSNTILQEVDGDGDGSLRNDAVGAALFGLSNNGDDPRWQYIVNVRAAFRNY